MNYQIQLSRSAERQLERFSPELRQRISSHITVLREEPRPFGSIRVKGRKDAFRIRVGDYRILYEVQDELLLVLVLKIAHRSDVYR